MNRRDLPDNFVDDPKQQSEKQEPSSRKLDRQHFSVKLHQIKKITEVSFGT